MIVHSDGTGDGIDDLDCYHGFRRRRDCRKFDTPAGRNLVLGCQAKTELAVGLCPHRLINGHLTEIDVRIHPRDESAQVPVAIGAGRRRWHQQGHHDDNGCYSAKPERFLLGHSVLLFADDGSEPSPSRGKDRRSIGSCRQDSYIPLLNW